MAKVFGIAKVILNGVDYRTMEGSTFSPGGMELTSHNASGKRVGTSEKPVGSKASVTFAYLSDTDVKTIRRFKDGQLQYVTDVNQVWDAPNSSLMIPPEFSDGGGGIKCEIEGDEAEMVS